MKKYYRYGEMILALREEYQECRKLLDELNDCVNIKSGRDADRRQRRHGPPHRRSCRPRRRPCHCGRPARGQGSRGPCTAKTGPRRHGR